MQTKNIFVLTLILITSFVLAGCATTPPHSGKDGAPKYYVDASKIKEPTPVKLPLSKTGNKTYSVDGHTYHVLKNAKGYSQVGYASWYGTKFDGHKTTTGDQYNMLQMTAASKTLPIPCFAKVTNLKTGKAIVVEVNDRGPFVKGRLIDLSYGAALKLGVADHGLAHVRVETIDPSNYHASPRVSTTFASNVHSPSDKVYYVQAAAVRNKVHAMQLAQQLHQDLGVKVAVYPKGHLYHIKTGPIYGNDNASQIALKMRQDGIPNPVQTTTV